MDVIGRVESLWRYPVKSMRGQEESQIFLSFAGVYADRLYAFYDAAARKGFPFLTARQQESMLLCQPKFRYPEQAVEPPNLADAESFEPSATPLYPQAAQLIVDIETPSGRVLGIDDPDLIAAFSERLDETHALSLLRSDRSFTDCRPVSIFSIQTVNQLGQEIGSTLDKRRFRANIYADFGSMAGFAENQLIGRTLQIAENLSWRSLTVTHGAR
jgi:uncharacterized protein YcbX